MKDFGNTTPNAATAVGDKWHPVFGNTEVIFIDKVFMISSGCARHSPVYVYISVKGSRVCKPCNSLAVRKYVRASMV